MARARIGLRDPDYLSRPSVPIFKRCIRAHWFPHRPSSDVRAVADIGNRTTFGMVSMNISCGPILLPRPRTRRRIRLLSGAPLFPTISNMLGDTFLGQWNSLVGYILYYAGPVKRRPEESVLYRHEARHRSRSRYRCYNHRRALREGQPHRANRRVWGRGATLKILLVASGIILFGSVIPTPAPRKR
jgi:hypothetical protein